MKCPNAATAWIVALTVVLGVAVVGVQSAAGTSVAPWTTFKSESEHLSVLMPGTPQAREKHNKSFVGDITTVEHYAKEGLDTYTVDYTSLPGFAISFSSADGIYDHAKSAVLKNTFSKPISYTDITLNGVQGKKLVYDTPTKPDHPEMQGEAQFFLFGEHLYTVDAVVEMKGAEKKLERFFSSLEISK
jgi:hypothetical protein